MRLTFDLTRELVLCVVEEILQGGDREEKGVHREWAKERARYYTRELKVVVLQMNKA